MLTLFYVYGRLDMIIVTVDPKSFDHYLLATLDERGQGVPNEGIKEGRERVTNVTRIKT